jgi:carboxylesterase
MERRRHQTYGKIPVVSVANLLDLQKKVRRELREIRQPTFIAHALDDETVPYGNLDYIRVCIGSDEVQTLTLKKSSHIITVDYDREVVAKRVVKFFKGHS